MMGNLLKKFGIATLYMTARLNASISQSMQLDFKCSIPVIIYLIVRRNFEIQFPKCGLLF